MRIVEEELIDESYERKQKNHGSYFHSFLEIIDDQCPEIEILEKDCACGMLRQGLVWSQVINKESDRLSNEDETRWLSIGYFPDLL